MRYLGLILSVEELAKAKSDLYSYSLINKGITMDSRKFKKISDDVFQTIINSDNERVVEYVRDVRLIHITLKDLDVRTSKFLHDMPFVFDDSEEKKLDIFERIKPEIKDKIHINAGVVAYPNNDLIYVAVPDSEDDSVHSVISSEEGPRVQISHNRQPLEGCADHGVHYISTVSGYDGDVYLDISLPESQIIALVKDLKEDPNTIVKMSIYLYGFGSAGQDYFDYWQSKKYLVEQRSLAFVQGVTCISKHGTQVEEKDEAEVELQQYESKIQNEQKEIRYKELIKRLDSLYKTIFVGFGLVIVAILTSLQ